MITHQAAEKIMSTGRKSTVKKIAGNTILYRMGDGFGVDFHGTRIVQIHSDGTYTLEAPAERHRTRTTKSRMRMIAGAIIYQHKYNWYIGLIQWRHGIRVDKHGFAIPLTLPADFPQAHDLLCAPGIGVGLILDYLEEKGENVARLRKNANTMHTELTVAAMLSAYGLSY